MNKIISNFKPVFLFLLLGLSLYACTPAPETDFDTEGYKPIYISKSSAFDIKKVGPTTIQNAGKIYVKDNYLFITEKNKGIHVINFSNPSSPVNEAFITVYGCDNMSIKDNFMFVDNVEDLVVLDISGQNVTEVKRLKNIFPHKYQMIPNVTSSGNTVWFECADTTKGILIGWEKAQLHNPKCKLGHDYSNED